MNLKDCLLSIFDSFSSRRTTLEIGYSPKTRNRRDKWDTGNFRERTMLLYTRLTNGSWNNDPFQAADRGREFWEQVHARLQMLYGQYAISRRHVNSSLEDLEVFLRECSPDRFFDFVEQSFKVEPLRYLLHEQNELVDAINEVFRFSTVPYQLTRMVKRVEKDETETDEWSTGAYTVTITAYPMFIRIDEETTHQEAVSPALAVLEAPHFEAANGDLRTALQKYKNNEFDECLTRCGSCFESVLKILCARRGWNPQQATTIGPLLAEVVKQSGIPSFLEPTLVSIATIRNRLSSAHGGGSQRRIATRTIAQYTITSTCAAIVLLTEEVGA